MEVARREAQEIIEDARRTANAASEEIRALKKQISDSGDMSNVNQRQAELRRSLNEAQSRIRADQPVRERPEPTRDILVGDTVELLKLGTRASVIAINKDGTYQLQAGILKMTARKDEIYLLELSDPYKEKHVRPAHSGREMKTTAMSNEVDLRGMDTIEAVCVMERYLDEAMRSNLQTVRIIHGKGTGAVRTAVHQALKKIKYVKKFRLGQYGEGEDGVTIVEFK
jgi:DNA mismatch repair protein MutS2